MSRHAFIAVLLCALLRLCAPAAASPVAAPAATPSSVTVGTAAPVTATVTITDPTLLPGGVNLVQEDASGKLLSTLGVMHDDGLAGDAVAGDHVYTLQVPLNPANPGTVLLAVSAAFKGQIKRVQSPPVTITVFAAVQPQITGFTPTSASVGQSVAVTGTGFTDAAGDTAHVLLAAPGGGTVEAGVTDGSATSLTFTVPVGAVSGPITVKVGAQSGSSSGTLTVTSSTPPVLSPSASGINLLQGQSAGYVVSFGPDPGFTQLASLSVAGLPDGVTGTFGPGAITSGQFSTLTVTAAKSQPVGDYPLAITATVTVNGVAQSQSVPVTLHVLPVTTSFIGRAVVDDALETPLAGVTVHFLGTDSKGKPTGANATTVSDASGNFTFTNLPAIYTGSQIVSYDGSTATSPTGVYAGVNLSYTLVGNQVTTPGILIHLPRIDNAETVLVPQNPAADQTYTFKSIPNLSVTVYAGTTFRLADGSQPNPFPLIAVQVPVDRLPDTMPQMQGGLMPFIVAFQPANTTASQPVAVTFPNTLMTAPNTDVMLSTLDPTQGLMVQYGTGMVSANGTQIVPDPDAAHPGHRYGLVHFDWHGPIALAVQLFLSAIGCKTVDPVDIGSGIMTLHTTDLAVSGPRGGLVVARNYRTFTTGVGPFGLGGSHSYNYQLNTNTLTGSAFISLIDPTGDPTPFARQSNGTYTSTGMTATQGAVLSVAADNSGADLRWKDGTVYHFVPYNTSSYRGALLTKITDRNGDVTTLTRNPSDPLQLTRVTDPVGRSLTFAYGNTAYPDVVTSVTDPAGRTVSYSYTPTFTFVQGVVYTGPNYPLLTSVTDSVGGVTQYNYKILTNGAVALASTVDPRGIVRGQNVFDDNGRVTQQTAPDGGVTHFSYTLLNPLVPTSPALRTVVTDPLGRSTTYRFSPVGYLLDTTDSSGQTTDYTLDPGTNQVLAARHSMSGAAPGDFVATYDANGNVLTQTDARGSTTTLTYEPVYNQVASVTDALGHKSTFTYDTQGNLLQATDANGKTTTLAYNQYGQPTQITDPLGHQVVLNYDASGNLITVTDPLGHTSSVKYDTISRPVQTTDALGRVATVQYDALNRVLTQTDPLGQKTLFTYDATGNLLSLTDTLGHQNSFTYDLLNHLVARTTPLGKIDTRQYDLAGNLTQFIDRRGQISQFAYDARNQLIGEIYQDGSQVTRTYDAYGRQSNVADTAGGAFSYAYDLDNDLLATGSPYGGVQYAYNSLQQLTARQVAGQSAVLYAYDPAGRLLSAAMLQAALNFAYDDANKLTGITRANGVASNVGYDAAGHLLSLTHSLGASSLYSQSYTYDAAGQRIASTPSSAQALITQSVTNTFDAENHLLTNGANTDTYDANGNLVSEVGPAGTTLYTWDTRGRLTSLAGPSGTTNFQYDAGGNLIAQKNPASGYTKYYVLDDITNVAATGDSTGASSAVLTALGLDSHLAVVSTSGQALYGLPDGLNSTIAVTDQSGNVKTRIAYEPYGQTTETGSEYPFQYTGRVPVPGSLYYNRARFYNSTVGQFISEDPNGFASGTNLSAYVEDNPVSRVDPTGLSFLTRFSEGYDRAEALYEPFGELLDFATTLNGIPENLENAEEYDGLLAQSDELGGLFKGRILAIAGENFFKDLLLEPYLIAKVPLVVAATVYALATSNESGTNAGCELSQGRTIEAVSPAVTQEEFERQFLSKFHKFDVTVGQAIQVPLSNR